MLTRHVRCPYCKISQKIELDPKTDDPGLTVIKCDSLEGKGGCGQPIVVQTELAMKVQVWRVQEAAGHPTDHCF